MSKSKKTKIYNARKINQMRCITGLVICSIVFVLTLVALILNITDFFNDNVPEAGFGTLKMFTTLSNLIAAFAAALCIPFQIDGLRKNKYKLPNWIVGVMYVGVVGVFLTFVVAITVIAIYKGFVYAMFAKSNLFMHTLNPIFIVILFTLTISDSHVRFRESLFTMIPVTIYSIIYFVCVFIAKIWNDHYQTNTIIPAPVTLILILSLAFGLSQLVRFLHNLSHKHVEKSIERYYLESEDYAFPTVTDAIAHLAVYEANYYHKNDDIYIPVDIINILSNRYGTNSVPVDILYDIYLERYLEQIKEKK